MNLTTEFYDCVSNSPAVKLMVKGWSELIDLGFVEDIVVINMEDNAIVAFNDGKPVGVISWQKAAWNEFAFIKMGYVIPEYRRQGIYTRLWEELKIKTKEQGLKVIETSTHIDNIAVRELNKKLGRKEVQIISQYHL